ncbi:MAG: bifunctional phosphopantothenoylcysteine decarboxylase/phosphopantothenate--cysteine ligase CoaBC [Acidimicrobiia bacterium]|nr:bifunctional phosphopantothenoylcysteine decarboxylase/phosphopantothenate--cysteine ligase CoaBC [Acidimicrobiia bacterium]
MLRGRRIVLGVAGGIAAFKAVYLARRLIERGAEVRVVMTAGATKFVGPQSFAAITGTPPITSLFGADLISPHTELARWADCLVIAPATANLIAQVANGHSSNALAATALAADVPVVLAPAMHTEMWEHPAVQRNIATLEKDGVILVGPTSGELAGGDAGVGRMVEPEEIVAATESAFDQSMGGWHVVISAGGTREAIDPVRYIGNRSSGKMGYAIADAASRRGARVTLVTTSTLAPPPNVTVVPVESAEEMAAAIWDITPEADVVVMAAAVADFRPARIADAKLARVDGPPEIRLEPTPNILAGVVERRNRATVVGFAAETGSLDRATGKAMTYGVDLLVANDVAAEGSGFGTETNQVTFIGPDGSQEPQPLVSKADVAEALCDRLIALRSA